MSVFSRAIHSYRFWVALVGLGTTVGIYIGMPKDTANELAVKVLAIIGLLIGGDTVRPTGK